jgi:hypothetical protein
LRNDSNTLFRFGVDQLYEITVELGMPTVFHTSDSDSFLHVEGLAILTRRLPFPSRLDDLVETFGRSSCALSRKFRHLLFLDGRNVGIPP